MDNIIDFQSLIEISKNYHLKHVDTKSANYFDVTGFPHYENVVSNVLCFFFDTKEEHGFEDLWIKSLIEAFNDKTPVLCNLENISTTDIKREYSNGSEKRIDLLIDCGDEVIIIENKIYARLYNDLDVYEKMTENYIGDSNNKTIGPKIVLSLYEIKDFDNACGFINVTYDELISKIEKNWGDYQSTQKWEIFAREFIDNLKSLKGVIDMEFDKEWLKLAKQTGTQIEKLINAYNDDLDKRLTLIKEINELCEEKGLNHRHGVYHGSKTDKYFSQYINLQISDASPTVETYIMKVPTGLDCEDYDVLYVSLWVRKNKNYEHFDKLLAAVDRPNAKLRTTRDKNSWGKHYILEELNITEDINLDKLADRIIGYVNAIDELNNKE